MCVCVWLLEWTPWTKANAAPGHGLIESFLSHSGSLKNHKKEGFAVNYREYRVETRNTEF